MKYHVYILISLKDHKFYTGYTTNLGIRMDQHATGKVESTRFRRPLQLLYYESYLEENDARRNEKYYKTTKGRLDLKKKLAEAIGKFVAQR